MKKFTLILAAITFVFSGFAQKNTAWQNKILKHKAKNELALKQMAMLSNLPGVSTNSTADPFLQLKSTAKQKLDSVVSWVYDESSKNWKYVDKQIYEYDNHMRTLSWLGNEWKDDTKTWKTEDKTEFFYESDGRLSNMISYSLDDANEFLVRDTKMEFGFKTGRAFDSLLVYSDEPKGTWTLNAKQFYYYDASERMIRWELWGIQDDEDEPNFGVWIKQGIFKFKYNSSGRIIKYETFMFVDGDEMPLGETVYTYNSSGQLTKSEGSSISFLTLGVEKSNLSTYQYNAAGDVSIETYSTWDKTDQKWNEKDKYENTYGTLSSADVVYPTNELLLIAILDPSQRVPNKAVTSDKTFEKIGDSWVQTDKSAYYYSLGGATKIDELEKPSLSFYPNPASENITLKWTARYNQLNLQVFQINGAKVMEQKIFSDEKVSVSHLVKGMYLLKLMDGQENVYTGKLMKN